MTDYGTMLGRALRCARGREDAGDGAACGGALSLLSDYGPAVMDFGIATSSNPETRARKKPPNPYARPDNGR